MGVKVTLTKRRVKPNCQKGVKEKATLRNKSSHFAFKGKHFFVHTLATIKKKKILTVGLCLPKSIVIVRGKEQA